MVIRVRLHRIYRERLHAVKMMMIVTEVRVEHLRTVCVHDLFTELQYSLLLLGRHRVILLTEIFLLEVAL